MEKFSVSFEKRAFIDSDGNPSWDFFPVFDYEFQVSLSEDCCKKNIEEQKRYCNEKFWDFYETHETFKKQILERVKKEAEEFKKDHPNLKYEYDEKIFNDAKKNNLVPPGRVWHHHEIPGVMQLVRESIHRRINHMGGASIWCKSSDKSVYSTLKECFMESALKDYFVPKKNEGGLLLSSGTDWCWCGYLSKAIFEQIEVDTIYFLVGSNSRYKQYLVKNDSTFDCFGNLILDKSQADKKDLKKLFERVSTNLKQYLGGVE